MKLSGEGVYWMNMVVNMGNKDNQSFEKPVVWKFMEENLKWTHMLKDWSGHTIDEMDCYLKCISP